MKSVGLGPAAYNQLQAMKKAVLGKVKGKHALHEKADLSPHVLRKVGFNNSEERIIAKNNMPGPGTYEPPEIFEDPDEVVA